MKYIQKNTKPVEKPSFPLVRHLPGLEDTQGLPNGGPMTYRPLFAGATREWTNDEDGWQTVRRRERRKKRKADESGDLYRPINFS